MVTPNPNSSSVFSYLCLFLFLLAVSGCNKPSDQSPQQIQIEVPEKNMVTFMGKLSLDPEAIYASAQRDNVSPKFAYAIESFHEQALQHLAQAHGLPASELEQYLQNYDAHKDEIIELHFNEFKKQMSELEVTEGSIIQNQYYDASATLAKVLGDYICDAMELSLGLGTAKASKVLTKEGYKYLVKNLEREIPKEIGKGTLSLHTVNQNLYQIGDQGLDNYGEVLVGFLIDDPCQTLTEYVMPTVTKTMLTMGVVTSMSKSQTQLQSYLHNSILELGVVEDLIQFNHSYTFRIEADRWNILSSTGSVTANVTAIAKAGFKLDEGYEVHFDHQQKKLYVQIPNPQILSIQKFMKYTDIKEGWLVEIESEELNEFERSVDQAVSQRLNEARLIEKAQDRAESVIQQLFTPLLLKPGYEVEVRFEPTETRS